MIQTDILFSIIIPTKNGEFWLYETLTAIVNQVLFSQSEIIVVDSGSTDKTLEILKEFPVRLIEIKPEAFNHGETRNVCVREAKGKYVVMTVQDAKPANENWLQYLLDGFVEENVAGVCGQQIVAHIKENNPVEWFYPVNKPSMVNYFFSDQKEFENLDAEKKKQICGWDNVNACYKRDMLLKTPFRKIEFAEDMYWAKDAIMSGFSIVYNTGARVYHYHQMSNEYAFKRSLTELYYRYKIIGYKPEPVNVSFIQYLRLIKVLMKRDVSFFSKFKWFKYNIDFNFQYKKAYNVFANALQQGDSVLDNTYTHFCTAPPQSQRVNK
jgi:rhamnosyltransferase